MLKRHLLRASALLPALAAAPALAEEPFLSGVYLGSQKLCDQAKSGSIQSVLDAGEYVLSARGLKSTGEDCQFLRVDKARGAEAWLISTLCLGPNGNYPDLYAVSKLPDGRVNVMSVYGDEDEDVDAQADTSDGSAGEEEVPQTRAPQPEAGGTAGSGAGSTGEPTDPDGDGVEAGAYVSCPGIAAP